MNEMLDAALMYARAGWRVFPVHGVDGGDCTCGDPACVNAGKHPIVATGFKAATIDVATVTEWWTRWPTANIGITTGKASGIVVLDVDPPDGEAQLASLEQQLGRLPETAEARTGSGGRHIYFAWPGHAVRNRQGVFGSKGLDVRGDGGYVVAPPSRHRSGRRYQWITPGVSIAPIPAALASILEGRHTLQGHEAGPSEDHSASALLPPPPPPQPGSRSESQHKAAVDLAVKLVRGGEQDGVRVMRLIALANAAEVPAGGRPLPEDEIRGVMQWAFETVKALPGATSGDVPKRLDPHFRTLGDLGWLTQDIPPRRWLLADLDDTSGIRVIPRGRVGLLTGAGGSGKSFLMSQLAVSIASGHPFLEKFRVVDPGPVMLLLGEEEVEEVARRIVWTQWALGLTTAEQALLAQNLVPMGLAGEDVALRGLGAGRIPSDTAVTAWLREKLGCTRVEWRALILDPISRFGGPDVEVDSHAATAFIECLERLTRTPGSPAVIACHHVAKRFQIAAGDETASRGSSALTDGARWVAHLEAIRAIDPSSPGGTRRDPELAVMRFSKANYGLWPPELSLARDTNGILRRANMVQAERIRAARTGSGKRQPKPKTAVDPHGNSGFDKIEA